MFYQRCAILLICTANIISMNHASVKENIVITIMSDQAGYHAPMASSLRDSLHEQAQKTKDISLKVVLTTELKINNTWTIGPLIPHLVSSYPNMDWYFFCEERTGVNLRYFREFLQNQNSTQEIWLGHALHDRYPTIIHHFADITKKFKYPNIASGFMISRPLMKNLAERYIRGEKHDGEFTIDAAYEFALFVWNAGKGKQMTHAREFCVEAHYNCTAYPRHVHYCGDTVSLQKMYVAIKTCSKYHLERIPAILKTWTKYATNIGFYSDKIDDNLPQAILTPNTTRGHCAKTFSILKHSIDVLREKKMDWLVITDDDTILSLGRLSRLLSCYNSKNFIALGERYGFRLSEKNGFNYLTGGAGLVLSTNLVEKLIEPTFCVCPTPFTPDDMFLFGVCLNRAGVQPTHLPSFHQARPADYAGAYLASHEPISFHKFWQVDPHEVYSEWFAEADDRIFNPRRHMDEL